MANVVYPKYKENMLGVGTRVDVDADVIKVVLVDAADYTYNAAHDFLDDVVAGARVATSPALAGKTQANGVFDANDVTFAAVTGDQAENIIFFDDTPAGDAAKQLMAFFDTFTSGMPVTPNGGDITYAFHASGIFAV